VWLGEYQNVGPHYLGGDNSNTVNRRPTGKPPSNADDEKMSRILDFSSVERGTTKRLRHRGVGGDGEL